MQKTYFVTSTIEQLGCLYRPYWLKFPSEALTELGGLGGSAGRWGEDPGPQLGPQAGGCWAAHPGKPLLDHFGTLL